MRLGKGCAYPGHRNREPIVAANGNPAALARPPPVVPLTSIPNTSLAIDDAPGDSSPVPDKTYRKPMDEPWEKQWLSLQQKRQVRKTLEEQQRADQRRVHHQIKICFWSEDNKAPEHLREQNIPTFPHFNLSQCLKLLRKMGLDADDEIYCYDFHARVWNRDNVDTTLRITADQTLLIRRLTVTECPSLDAFIAQYSSNNGGLSKGKAATMKSQKRKPDHERNPSNRNHQFLCIDTCSALQTHTLMPHLAREAIKTGSFARKFNVDGVSAYGLQWTDEEGWVEHLEACKCRGGLFFTRRDGDEVDMSNRGDRKGRR